MSNLNSTEMEIMGYQKVYDYTQYSQDNNVNVMPEEPFKRLVTDTFRIITDTLRSTYGPYGSTMIISDQNQTTTTKDGFNVFEAMGFSHPYKRMVYLAIKKICERVNRNVGDGTTSCILLAEKIFNKVNVLINTPDEKRAVLSILSSIEKQLQNSDLMELHKDEGKWVKPVDKNDISTVISMASNGDEDLTDILTQAFNPQVIEQKIHVRNVVADCDTDMSADINTTYKIDYLPGDYRIRFKAPVDAINLAFAQKNTPKIVLYNYIFDSSSWAQFMKNYDKVTPTIIIATNFATQFLDHDYMRYINNTVMTKTPITVFLAQIQGTFVQNEISDLAALLCTTPYSKNYGFNIDHSELPTATVQIYKGDALCFYDVKSPTEYIEKLTSEMENDKSRSYVKKCDYLNRIKALSLDTEDTLVVVKTPSSLEAKMIMDKIDDCTSIITSAVNTGIVPNLLSYAKLRLGIIDVDYINNNADWSPTDLNIKIVSAIKKSINGLFYDIWASKYGCDQKMDEFEETLKNIGSEYCSYDIINEKYCTVDELSTSAQYDIEVVVAAISIVKYLLTSRALIFDTHLLTPVNDVGRYQQM